VTVFLLGQDPEAFPPPERADRSGLLAIGGDLTPARLLAGYRRGIFPWYSEGQPILWHSPDPRFVLLPGQLHVPRSLEKVLRRGTYAIRADTAFSGVLEGCAAAPRPGQDGTWITPEMHGAYTALHRLGHAHSVEAEWACPSRCSAMDDYRERLRDRRSKEAETLASLTGWSMDDIRRKMGPDGADVKNPRPWYRRLWNE